jgi:hypothetical protein
MDSKDLLNQCRNNYFIGNYYKVLELWNENVDENFGKYLLEVDFIVARSIISQKFLLEYQVNFTKKPSK